MDIKKITLLLLASVFFICGAVKKDAPKRDVEEIKAVLAKAPARPKAEQLKPLNIVLVAGPKDHGENEHDYPLWQKRWKKLLTRPEAVIAIFPPPPPGTEKVKVDTAWEWPSKEQFKRADLIVMHTWGRWTEEKIADLKQYLLRGGGFVSVHPTLITDKKFSGQLSELLGLAWEHGYSWYRYGDMDLKITAAEHPICLGLPGTIRFLDEAYWPLKGDLSKVTVLATSDEKVKDSEKTRAEPMFWTYEYGKGRVFACILGHYTWTCDDAYFRLLVLRGMAWAAGESPYRFDPLVIRKIK